MEHSSAEEQLAYIQRVGGSNPSVPTTPPVVYRAQSITCGGRSINTARRICMQKLIDTLKSFGIEIPDEKQTEVKRALSEHYKNAGEVARTMSKVEGERDSWKERAEAAENTLKGFEGIDPEKIQAEIADWKKKAEDAEKDYNAKLYERDFSDALKTALDNIKFSSEAAKKSVMADIKEAGLKLKDGKILGLNDLIEQMKQSDASAFVDEAQQRANQNAARFTTAAGKAGQNSGTKPTMTELMRMKNEDPSLDITQYM